jgi:hypothetical protein
MTYPKLVLFRCVTFLAAAATAAGCAKATPGGKVAPMKAKGITVQVDEDTRKDILLAVETPNSRMRFSVSAPPESGSIEKFNDSTGVVSYRPQPNFNGVDHFKYEVEDLLTKSSEEVTIVVLPVNDAPVAEEKAFTTVEDTQLTGTFSGKDIDSSTLSFSVSTPPTKGTVTIDSNLQTFVYVPNADQDGEDTFLYRASDGLLFSEPKAVKITITPVKDAPTARPLTVSTEEDTRVSSNLVATDPDSANLTYAMASAPTKGVVMITNAATGAFEYRPNLDLNGSDSFTFTATDGELTSAPATVTININPVNDPPVVTADTISILPTALNTFTVRAVDPDGDALRFSIATDARSGKVEVADAAAGRFTYQPNQDDSGADSFTVIASDGSANSAAVEIKFRWLSTVSVAGEKSATAIDGSKIYTGMDSSTIEIYSASGTSPSLLGSFSTLGKPIHIEAFNRKLLVNTSGPKAGFYVYDTTNPASVQLLASIRGSYSSFKAVNNFAFLTGSAIGSAVSVVNTDLRNTLVPLQSVSVVTSTANAIDIRDNYAYVATNEGLRIIDISNPANLQLRGLVPTRNMSLGVSVKGDRAYVADGSAGVFLVDISNPSDPREIARYTPRTAKVFSYVDVTDFYLLANGSLLSPTTLTEITSAPTFTWRTLSSLPSAAVRVSANNIDLFEAVSASAINRFAAPGSLDGVNDFTSSGNIAYAATRSRGLSIIDLAAGQTKPLSHLFDEEAQCSIAYGAPVIFLASCQNTIRVVNVSNPLIPSLMTATNTASGTRYRRLQFVSPYLYASTQSGIEIFEANVTTGALSPLGQFVLSPDVGAFSVLGDTLYISSDAGVSVVDLKDRRSPRLAMRLNLPLTDTILASAPFLFVKASGDEDPSHTVFIYDITNPLSPALTSQYREADSIGDFFRSGTNLFVAYSRKLVRLDLRDPARPVKIELIPAPNTRTNFTRLQLQLPKIIAVDLVYGRLSVFDNVPNLTP